MSVFAITVFSCICMARVDGKGGEEGRASSLAKCHQEMRKNESGHLAGEDGGRGA